MGEGRCGHRPLRGEGRLLWDVYPSAQSADWAPPLKGEAF